MMASALLGTPQVGLHTKRHCHLRPRHWEFLPLSAKPWPSHVSYRTKYVLRCFAFLPGFHLVFMRNSFGTRSVFNCFLRLSGMLSGGARYAHAHAACCAEIAGTLSA